MDVGQTLVGRPRSAWTLDSNSDGGLSIDLNPQHYSPHLPSCRAIQLASPTTSLTPATPWEL
ncbi:hypothetical protein BD311DRAFT_761579 [Dichomitus squalens]|uniref:Uncharacterized protein n=1 Tax=Dichomitus squalens TaxID=114155 RepID=A0A4Q9MHS3_9APHY|nr:hypothetical protein BD311DRAFT_761579 [Dichomitus squalens]